MTLQHAPAEKSRDGAAVAEGVPSAIPPHDEFYGRLVARTRNVIGDECQQRLRTAPIVVAGCGAIGGGVVEPLVRLGAEHLILADPGAYDIADLSRASVWLRDVGRNKAEALAERAREVNPYATVIVEPRGIAEATVRALVRGAAVIVDGLGEHGASEARRRLHGHARELRVPVVGGYEDGGRCGVVVYDYRRPARAGMAGRVAAVVQPALIGENLRRSRGRIATPRPGYTPALFGTLALPAVLALIAGEPVVRRFTVDPCALMRPAPVRLRRWLSGMRLK